MNLDTAGVEHRIADDDPRAGRYDFRFRNGDQFLPRHPERPLRIERRAGQRGGQAGEEAAAVPFPIGPRLLRRARAADEGRSECGRPAKRHLSAEEIASLKAALDSKMYRHEHLAINQTFYRLRLLVLIALTKGMRMAEIFALTWGDVLYGEGLIAVRSKLKGGKIRYVPMIPELTAEIRRFPAIIGEDRIFPPKHGAKGERQRVEGSFETILELAGIGISASTICGTRSHRGT